jgi:cytochrome c biogenesis protein CcmG/thiol:disulfide interchange protein DsbE
MRYRWLLGIGLAAVIGIAWIGWSRSGALGLPVREAPQPGYRAPDFSLPALSEETLTLSRLRGRAVVLNFWATWCPPCRAEMPAFQRLYARYADRGLMVIAINATFSDAPEAVADFRRRYGLTFPILLDASGAVNQRYRVTALPTTFFIDPQGTIREVVVGGPMSEAAIEARVRTLLSEGAR